MKKRTSHGRARHIAEHVLNSWGLYKKTPFPLAGYTVFFDVDGTLSRNNLLSIFMHTVSMRGLLPRDKATALQRAKREYVRRRWSYSAYEKVLISSLHVLQGLPRWLLDHIFDLTFQEFEATYYVFTYTFLNIAQQLGARLYAVTGALEPLLVRYLHFIGLKVDGYFCSSLLFDRIGFTGEVDVSVVQDKGRYISSIAERYGFNLNKSIFLGDTEGDITLMKLVKYPLGVNPNQVLVSYLAEHQVPWVVERKDVILLIDSERNVIL